MNFQSLTIFYAFFLYRPQIHHADNILMLLILALEACYAFGFVFVICELCQRVSNAFNDLNDKVFEFNWYLFPATVKQMLPTIMLYAQQPIVFQCFGSFSCSREAFKQVSFCFTLYIFECIDIDYRSVDMLDDDDTTHKIFDGN